MNQSKFLADCAFDDELGLETNADRLEERLKAILRHRPEDWLRGLPQMFSPEWKEAILALRKELKRTPTVGVIVMMGHVFQIQLSDEEVLAVLDTMRRHLKAGGTAAFETRNPNIDWAHIWGTHAPVVHTLPNGHVRETLEITSEFVELISF